MKFSTAALSATLLALAGTVVAQLEVTSPGGPNLWWIAQSDNVVRWTCKSSPYTNFTVLIANSDPKVLVGPQAFIAQQNNFDCSKLITKDQVNMPVGTGYTIQLADPFNSTHVYAQSEPFEIKNLGAAYPASSATPTNLAAETGSATGTASGTSTGSSAATGTNTASGTKSQNNGAASLSTGGLTAVAVAAFGLMFA